MPPFSPVMILMHLYGGPEPAQQSGISDFKQSSLATFTCRDPATPSPVDQLGEIVAAFRRRHRAHAPPPPFQGGLVTAETTADTTPTIWEDGAAWVCVSSYFSVRSAIQTLPGQIPVASSVDFYGGNVHSSKLKISHVFVPFSSHLLQQFQPD